MLLCFDTGRTGSRACVYALMFRHWEDWIQSLCLCPYVSTLGGLDPEPMSMPLCFDTGRTGSRACVYAPCLGQTLGGLIDSLNFS